MIGKPANPESTPCPTGLLYLALQEAVTFCPNEGRARDWTGGASR